MFDRIETMRMAQALTRHAGARQKLVAQNIANADTPGYRAKDSADFASIWRSAGSTALRTTDTRHISGTQTQTARLVDAGGEASPNGNTVSLEEELVRQASTRRSFDLGVIVFQSGLSLMRAGLGRR